ncbi:MAG: hypothetical protein DYG89_54905, partial [Caldilinea sp. CFX5]|nr:hypothetical protein [Caldilinea sp. CFX5]
MLPNYEGMIVRSAVTVDRGMIEAMPRMLAIGRAGAGVDNIDVVAATERGIVVMNTPGGNTISAAEHTLAMLMSLLRKVPAANASLRRGEWDRKTFVGTELFGKRVGVLGLGRIGREVAARIASFQAHVVGYDPVLSPDGRYVLSGSFDSTARVWDLRTGAEVRRFVSYGGITSVAFSPDGQTVLLGDGNGPIRLWDVQPPPDPRTFSGHTAPVIAAKFSPDGRTLLTGSTDQTARLWDAATGRELRVLTGHTDWVIAVAISPDGHYALTSGAADNTARLWELGTGQEVHVFKHPAPLFGVAFSPDGRYILTGGDDSVTRFFKSRTQAP